jgi:hypothetical protein
MKPVRIRYSDFTKHNPIHIVIKNFNECYFWNKKYIVFNAFLCFCDKIRECEVMFPYYPFITAYLKLPVRIRLNAGSANIQMIITKLDRGRMDIKELKKWEEHKSESQSHSKKSA